MDIEVPQDVGPLSENFTTVLVRPEEPGPPLAIRQEVEPPGRRVPGDLALPERLGSGVGEDVLDRGVVRAGEAVRAVGMPDEEHLVRRDARHAQQVREAQVTVHRGRLGRRHDPELRVGSGALS